MTATPRHVLVVEDHAGYAQLVELRIHEALGTGVTVSLAATFAAARDRLQDGGIDCVLLDLSLPDERGPQVVSRLREAAPDVPVIVLSARDEPGLAAELELRGAVDFVGKDATRDELVTALSRVLGR